MKKISLFAALLMAAAFLSGCKTQNSAPSALDVIMTRTSIRSFTGEAVSKDQLETILKAGMAAPTAMNGQPWRFVVVTDQDKIKETFGAGPETYMQVRKQQNWTWNNRLVPNRKRSASRQYTVTLLL